MVQRTAVKSGVLKAPGQLYQQGQSRGLTLSLSPQVTPGLSPEVVEAIRFQLEKNRIAGERSRATDRKRGRETAEDEVGDGRLPLELPRWIGADRRYERSAACCYIRSLGEINSTFVNLRAFVGLACGREILLAAACEIRLLVRSQLQSERSTTSIEHSCGTVSRRSGRGTTERVVARFGSD
jgi:hypothetical protein